MPLPSVGVVVVTRDREDELSVALERLTALPDAPPVVVVDNGSRDGTVAMVRHRFPRVGVVPAGRNLGAAGRTIGVRLLRTEVVAFADDDSWWAPDALPTAAAAFAADPALAVVAGRVLVGPEQRTDPVCEAMAASPVVGPASAWCATTDAARALAPVAVESAGPLVLGFVACGAVVRREAYLQVGGFHPRYGVGGEEELLALDLAAAGWTCRYVDTVLAHHHPSPARDPARRRSVTTRNELWTAMLRRPRSSVVSLSTRRVVDGRRDPAVRRGVVAAMGGLGWVLRERRVVAPALEAELVRMARGTAVPAAAFDAVAVAR